MKQRRRNLTAGEENLARYVFRNSIAYSEVQVVAAIAFVRWAPFGNIRWPFSGNSMYDLIGDDFHKPKSVPTARLFLHELTHVWQHYVGMRVTLCAFGSYAAAVLRTGSRKAAYVYHIAGADIDSDLLDYTVDQQAEIIADYYAHALWNQPVKEGMFVQDYRMVLRSFHTNARFPLDTSVMRRFRAQLRS